VASLGGALGQMTVKRRETGYSEPEVFADELAPGTVLLHGQYTIQKFLNVGGFGITYLASDQGVFSDRALFEKPVARPATITCPQA
jgi:hypothetical protein